MPDLMPEPYGKELPAFYAWNYIYAYESTIGRNATNAVINIGAQLFCADPAERRIWVEPIFEVFHPRREQQAEPAALDYALIKIFYRGLIEGYPQQSYLASRIGAQLWKGYPSSQFTLVQGIQSAIAAESQRDLAQLTRAYREKHGRPMSDDDAVAAGLALALRRLGQQSGLDMRLGRQGEATIITSHGCPFCIDAPCECTIGAGIITGMLGWLNALLDRGHVRPARATIDPERSSGHRVIVTVEPNPAYLPTSHRRSQAHG